MTEKHIHLAGYSFGAWVIYLGLEKYTSVKKVVLVSPPVGFLDFSPNIKSSKIELIIAGSNDDIADPERIQDTIPR
jgi:alpha/beta superfamily hydrolase